MSRIYPDAHGRGGGVQRLTEVAEDACDIRNEGVSSVTITVRVTLC